MNIHEYQAKELLESYGVPVPPGEVVYTERAAARVAEDLGGSRRVEEVAAATPDAITREEVDPGVGLLDFQCRKLATAIGLGPRAASFTRLLKRIYRLFRDKDLLLLEINPFIVTEDGDMVALDAKVQ